MPSPRATLILPGHLLGHLLGHSLKPGILVNLFRENISKSNLASRFWNQILMFLYCCWFALLHYHCGNSNRAIVVFRGAVHCMAHGRKDRNDRNFRFWYGVWHHLGNLGGLVSLFGSFYCRSCDVHHYHRDPSWQNPFRHR